MDTVYSSLDESDQGTIRSQGTLKDQPSNVPSSSADRIREKLKNKGKSFVKETVFGPPVENDLAETVNQGLQAQIDHRGDEIQKLLKQYERPENCSFLDVPKVEKSLWISNKTDKSVKDSDKLFQRTQMYLTKGMIPLVQVMDKSIKAETMDKEEVFDLAMDAFSLLAHAHKDMSNQRKRLITPAINTQYRVLCNESSPITATQLFGDDINKQIKDIDDSRKLGNSLIHTKTNFKGKAFKQFKEHRKETKPYGRFQQHKSSSSTKDQSFLEKGSQRTPYPSQYQPPHKKVRKGYQGHQK